MHPADFSIQGSNVAPNLEGVEERLRYLNGLQAAGADHAGGLGYRPAGPAKPETPHKDGGTQQVFRPRHLCRLRFHNGPA